MAMGDKSTEHGRWHAHKADGCTRRVLADEGATVIHAHMGIDKENSATAAEGYG
jgi:hypothetical protein